MASIEKMLRLAYQDRCPKAYKELVENYPSFFSETAEEAYEQISQLALQMQGPDVPGETTLEKAGRLNAIRLQAKEIVLHDLIPEPEEPNLDVDGKPMERFEWDPEASDAENREAQLEWRMRILDRLRAYQTGDQEEEESGEED